MSLTPAEQAASQSGVAIYANQVTIAIIGSIARIAFMEVGSPPKFCGAFVVPVEVAKELATILQAHIAQYEKPANSN